MNFQNALGEGAIAISLTGMLIVFCGLFLLSLYIGFLPRILTWVERLQAAVKQKISKESKATHLKLEIDTEDEIAVAIGLVMHLEKQKFGTSSSLGRTLDILGTTGKLSSVPKRRLYA